MRNIITNNCGETNGLVDPDSYHANVSSRIKDTVPWNIKGLRITRFRLLSDPGFPVWDVSYCHGQLDGEPVDVELPFFQLPKRGWRKAVVEYAKRDGVYAKGIGIFENVSTLC